MDGNELKQRREKLNLSQSNLAKLIGVRQQTVSDWESEQHKIQHPKLIDLALQTIERERETQNT